MLYLQKELPSITGPNKVAFSLSSPEDGNRSSCRNVVFSSSLEYRTKSRNAVIVLHHRQIPLDCNYCICLWQILIGFTYVLTYILTNPPTNLHAYPRTHPHLRTYYLPTYTPIHSRTYLPAYLPTLPSTYLPTYRPTCPPTHFPTHQLSLPLPPTDLPIYPLTYFRTYQLSLALLPTYPPTYLPTYVTYPMDISFSAGRPFTFICCERSHDERVGTAAMLHSAY
jgi:hypothetical protein